MSLYDVDIALFARNTAPSVDTTEEDLAMRRGLLSAMGRVFDSLKDYKEGSTAPIFSGTANLYDQISFNNAIYECIVAVTSNDPAGAPQDWSLILPSAVGSDETQIYNSGKLSLEWALNKRFGLTFNQPPNTPDIYIQTNVITNIFFRVGAVETTSSAVGFALSTEFIPFDALVTPSPPNFTIFFPTADYASLGVNAESIIRSFVDRYVAYSITYNIQTY